MLETTFECYPQKKMRKGDKCWCLSGRRWQDCHMKREKLPPINIEETKQAEKHAQQHTQCLHPDAPHNCSGNTIQSHSVQKNTSLKAIAKKGHVLTMKTMTSGEISNKKHDDSILKIEKIGINKASTFPGFCNHHDTELFRPVETREWEHSRKNAFLLSLRAISIEYYKKKYILKFTEWHLNNCDRGDSFENQIMKQISLRSGYISFKYGYDDLCYFINIYHKIYKSQNFSKYRYVCIEFDKKCPVVSCGTLVPEYDFHGKFLQSIVEKNIEEVCINLYSLEKESLCIIGYIDGPSRIGKRFTESLLSIPHERIPNTIIQMVLSSFENTYFNEDWYNFLDTENKKNIYTFLENNADPSTETNPVYLVDCGWNIFDGKISNISKDNP